MNIGPVAGAPCRPEDFDATPDASADATLCNERAGQEVTLNASAILSRSVTSHRTRPREARGAVLERRLDVVQLKNRDLGRLGRRESIGGQHLLQVIAEPARS